MHITIYNHDDSWWATVFHGHKFLMIIKPGTSLVTFWEANQIGQFLECDVLFEDGTPLRADQVSETEEIPSMADLKDNYEAFNLLISERTNISLDLIKMWPI